MQKLDQSELVQLVKAVFPALSQDQNLAIIVDVPNDPKHDTPHWKIRRQLADEWAKKLQAGLDELELKAANLFAYASVDSNNADLPEFAYKLTSPVPDSSSALSRGQTGFNDVFASHQLFLAPTQFSTTAPMKVNARKFGFRAATMPGFAPAMIPALRIDYALVNERCQLMKSKLDPAVAAKVSFVVDGETEYTVNFDLRHRPAHASGGRFPEPGTAGNLPSGETYIVPYEGEMEEPSETFGTLPVQFSDEIVLFKIEANTATGVLSTGPKSLERADYLKREPAYGNMAELGFGILADFGLEPIREILLDEKLAFHVAFGRSDHFGGATGPHKFSSPRAVVHIDYIYSPKMQPRIRVQSIDLVDEYDNSERIIENDQYLLF